MEVADNPKSARPPSYDCRMASSSLRKWIMIHPLARVVFSLSLLGSLGYYAVVSELHLLQHYSPPLASTVMAAVLAVLGAANVVVLARTPLSSPSSTATASASTVGLATLILCSCVAPAKLATRYAYNAGIVIPSALQVVGKVSLAGACLTLSITSIRYYLRTRTMFAEARKG